MRRASPERTPHARAAGNNIGDAGAKELAAALKPNKTLTTLELYGACRGAALPTPPAAPPHAHARVREGCVRRASPERTPHARSPRPQSLRVRPPPRAAGNRPGGSCCVIA